MSRVATWTRVGGRLRLVADQSLHHEGVLEVADVVAVLGLALVDPWEVRHRKLLSGTEARTERPTRTTATLTSVGHAAAQAVRVLPVAQAVDERSQLMHVVHFSRHHHLFMDDVGLRQVCPLLQGRKTTSSPGRTRSSSQSWDITPRQQRPSGRCISIDLALISMSSGGKSPLSGPLLRSGSATSPSR